MNTRMLVYLLGQLRADPPAWDNFKHNVLDELSADLAIRVVVERGGCRQD